MIEAAIASGDKSAAETVLRFARQANPGASAEIDAIAQRFSGEVAAQESRAAAERAATPVSNGMLDLWNGQVELGASRSTGRSRSLGVFGSFDVAREGVHWRHKLAGRTDFQSTNDVTSAERASSSYQANYKVGERVYGFGLLEFEHDRFARHQERYTAGAGFGYGVLVGKDLDLDLQGGPTFRLADPGDEDATSQLVGRASLRLKWKITPTLQLAQDSALYLESGTSNATVLTALDTKLIGALRARLSYQARYESDPAAGAKGVNTQSRATFVYSF